MTLFGKKRDAAKARREQQGESGAVGKKTGMRRDQYGSMREGVGARRKERAARVAQKAADRQASGKKLSKRQQALAEEHSYNVGRQSEGARYQYEKEQSKEADVVAKQEQAEASRQEGLLAKAKSKTGEGQEAGMPAVDTTEDSGSVKTQAKATRGGYTETLTKNQLKAQNRAEQPTSQGVTWRTKSSGDTSARIYKKRGESKEDFNKRRAQIRKNTESDPNIT